ncbi:hypothetical protein NIES593_19270 [Hydrococcus rivularis NIES-593]|uniref:HTH cro/C1-type domain-containing protein n=1 Tax=Hydrococcus rivularis NIES-593 TaxID=1921803 RepID=A0A1U7H9N5_9CYAN|nr:XRE family transcriptional regulator [Hydrococcus rivularis]OKH20251.1 hypothetical protein NIES593_19270 [Hydrococcus rivularis NIES-593]
MHATTDTQLKPELTKLGRRLRALRNERGWTLEELARRTGISEAYLSRLESGDRQPSLAVLLNLAQTYGLTLPLLFEPALEAASQEHKATAGVIIRAKDAATKEGNGLFYTSLAGSLPTANLHPIRVKVPAERKQEQLYQHDGEEWLYVLSGKVVLALADEEYLLHPGDAAHFDASTPHRLLAKGERDAEILLVACATPRSLLKSYL